MKTYFLLAFILLLGLILVLGAVGLWHLSSTTEFTRTDVPVQQSQ